MSRPPSSCILSPLRVHLNVPTFADGNLTSPQHTPNTPELLNAIVSMDRNGPFAGYSAAAVPDARSTSVVSVDAQRSQLIKEGLKLKVKQKLDKCNNKSALQGMDLSVKSPTPSIVITGPNLRNTKTNLGSQLNENTTHRKNSNELAPTVQLSITDIERRNRRRERNKLAATKCRNKKKLLSGFLLKESDVLKQQNTKLWQDMLSLEAERHKLLDLLNNHGLQQEPCLAKSNVCHGSRQTVDESITFRIPDVPTDGVAASASQKANKRRKKLNDFCQLQNTLSAPSSSLC